MNSSARCHPSSTLSVILSSWPTNAVTFQRGSAGLQAREKVPNARALAPVEARFARVARRNFSPNVMSCQETVRAVRFVEDLPSGIFFAMSALLGMTMARTLLHGRGGLPRWIEERHLHHRGGHAVAHRLNRELIL